MADNNSNNNSQVKQSSSRLSFPKRLHGALNAVEENNLQQVISWTNGGKAFKVHDLEKFERDILPRFFNTKKYASFTRALHAHGFKCARAGRQTGVYSHPLFQRYDEKSLSLIKRTKKGSSSPASPSKAIRSTSTISVSESSEASSEASIHRNKEGKYAPDFPPLAAIKAPQEEAAEYDCEPIRYRPTSSTRTISRQQQQQHQQQQKAHHYRQQSEQRLITPFDVDTGSFWTVREDGYYINSHANKQRTHGEVFHHGRTTSEISQVSALDFNFDELEALPAAGNIAMDSRSTMYMKQQQDHYGHAAKSYTTSGSNYQGHYDSYCEL